MDTATEALTSEKERAILAAARRRFAYYGYSKVTMDEIASDIPMAKASLYYYFPTKETLLTSVLRQEKKQFTEEMQVILEKKITAGEKMKQYVQKRFSLFRELVNLSALSASRIGEISHAFAGLFAELEHEEYQLVLRILQEGKRAGEFHLLNLQQTSELIPHVLHGLRLRGLRQAHDGRLSDDAYETIRQEGRLLIEHLLHGITRQHQE